MLEARDCKGEWAPGRLDNAAGFYPDDPCAGQGSIPWGLIDSSGQTVRDHKEGRDMLR